MRFDACALLLGRTVGDPSGLERIPQVHRRIGWQPGDELCTARGVALAIPGWRGILAWGSAGLPPTWDRPGPYVDEVFIPTSVCHASLMPRYEWLPAFDDSHRTPN